ncbi:MAG: cell division protein FtsQ/DivIB [Gaiellaceae bacterium]
MRAASLPARRGAPPLSSIVPSGRSLVIGLLLLVGSIGAYIAARETSIFAVRTVEVRGGSPALQAQVRAALRDEVGQSLLKVDGSTLARRVAPIPGVRAFEYDRAFPNTLRIVIHPEQPVLVVRRGADAFLVAATGRVVASMRNPRLSHLPRLWAPRDTRIAVGEPLPASLRSGAAVLGPLRGASLPGGVRTVRAGKELTLELGGGLEVRLGDGTDLRLKLAIARLILRSTGAAATGAGYLDVSVPERPVLSAKSQVEG